MSCCAAHCIPVLIQQNVDGSNFFNRSWAEFKVGFNDTRGNYWLGNDRISQLTLSGNNYKLRFDLQLSSNLSWYWAEYIRFAVHDELRNYQIQVSGFSGNVGGDAFGSQSGMMFTTYDRDNDPWKASKYGDNCAVYNGAGFWHNACTACSVNGIRGRGNDFRWSSPQTGSLRLQTSRMWITC